MEGGEADGGGVIAQLLREELLRKEQQQQQQQHQLQQGGTCGALQDEVVALRLELGASNERLARLEALVQAHLGPVLPPVAASLHTTAAAAAVQRYRGQRGLRLNLGCGYRKLPGHVNVDANAAVSPDVVHDLEVAPWPFGDGAAREVVLRHSLEHVGGTPRCFRAVLRELYRVCAHGATVRITVPHAKHELFQSDPTHVRPVSLRMLEMLSAERNRAWRAEGSAHTPLALALGVDFRIVGSRLTVDQGTAAELVRQGVMSEADATDNLPKVIQLSRMYGSLISELFVELAVVKAGAGGGAQRAGSSGAGGEQERGAGPERELQEEEELDVHDADE